MAIAKYIRRKDYGIVSSGSEVSLGEDTLLLNREIYQELGNLTKNKTLSVPIEIRTKYDRFIKEMNDWSLGLIEPSDELKAIDEYLGGLGLDYTYPFTNDIPDIENWIDYTSKSKFRNIGLDADNIVYNNNNVVFIGD